MGHGITQLGEWNEMAGMHLEEEQGKVGLRSTLNVIHVFASISSLLYIDIY